LRYLRELNAELAEIATIQFKSCSASCLRELNAELAEIATIQFKSCSASCVEK